MLKPRIHSNGSVSHVHLAGWKRQAHDARDEAFRVKLPAGFKAIPTSVDNRNVCSPIEDQGELGSCTANMFAGLVESNEIKAHGLHTSLHAAAVAQVIVSSVITHADGTISYSTVVKPVAAPVPPTPTPVPPTPTPPTPPPVPPTPPTPPPPTPPTPPAPPAVFVKVSRLFEYYGTRKIEGTVSTDSGASIRDAIKCGVTYGIANEATWNYDITKFATNPPASVWTTALTHKVTSYHSVADGDVATMKSTLAQGYLIGFGFDVYDYFMSQAMATTGILPVPGPTEQLQGGHAVCLVGYDDSKKAFLVRNSWGTAWGIAGYFWMAYDYVANTALCSDFWVVASAAF